MGDVFKALADPTRQVIVDELFAHDGQTLFEICVRLTSGHGLEMSRQAVSQHLDLLEEAGLIRTERRGRSKFHYLDLSALEGAVERWLPKKKGRQK
jgi:DNA-binding transcriptional ArsR family regulator